MSPDQKTPDQKPSSPCVNLCKLQRPAEICVGCRRTLAEIRAWKNMSETERLSIMRELPSRPDLLSLEAG
jgi:predicted Fe-S protein YdhL (DUF1289 family)